MDNPLEYILTHYQLPKYKDFSSRAVLKALVNTLNHAELKELQGKLKRGTSPSNIGNELYNEIEKTLNANQPQKNEPISYLLKQFTDKRSGKVAISRPKLQDRFDKQDFHSQRKILKAFLAGSKRDRVWAYKKLKRNWDAFFADEVQHVFAGEIFRHLFQEGHHFVRVQFNVFVHVNVVIFAKLPNLCRFVNTHAALRNFLPDC